MENFNSGGSYDDLAQRLIPGYASLARLSVALVAGFPSTEASASPLLVVGCGTGAELSEALAQRPDWRLTAVDPDANMLAAARQRLGSKAEAITWVQGPVESLPGEACFAGAIAVLVLQELADDGRKLAFLSALARLLQPGSPLVLVDLMGGGSELNSSVESLFDSALRRFRQGGGAAGVGEPPAQLHPIGEARRLALMAAAGFSDPLRFFQALQVEGVVVQRRR